MRFNVLVTRVEGYFPRTGRHKEDLRRRLRARGESARWGPSAACEALDRKAPARCPI